MKTRNRIRRGSGIGVKFDIITARYQIRSCFNGFSKYGWYLATVSPSRPKKTKLTSRSPAALLEARTMGFPKFNRLERKFSRTRHVRTCSAVWGEPSQLVPDQYLVMFD